MNKKKKLLLSGLILSNVQDFVYGNLSERFPDYSYDELKEIRSNNWELLKSRSDSYKTTGLSVNAHGEIEFYRPINETITIGASQEMTINGNGINTTLLKFYPFTMRSEASNYSPFKLEYGGSIVMKNLKHTLAKQAGKFETYNTIIKKNGNARLIEITDSDIRDGFWDSLSVGDSIYYSWDITKLAETRLISSWDSNAKTITVSSDIGASISSGTAAYLGKQFSEDISEEDYDQYGNFFLWGELNGVKPQSGIQHLPSASTGENALFHFENVDIANWNNGITISSGNFHMTYNNLLFSYNSVGLGAFGRSQIGQNLIGEGLTFRYNGLACVGQINFLSNNGTVAIFGGGGYVHPTIVHHEDVELTLFENVGFQFKHFSTSIEILYPGQQTYIRRLIATGGLEYDYFSSNAMPVVIDYIEARDIRVGGTITTGEGEITEFIGGSVSMEPPDGEETIWTFNDLDFYGLLLTEYNPLTEAVHDIIFNDTIFWSDAYSELPLHINAPVNLRKLQLNNCYQKKKPGSTIADYTPGQAIPAGDECTYLSYGRGFRIEFNNLTNDFMKGGLLLHSPFSSQTPPYNTSKILINDSSINLSRLSQLSGTTQTYLTEQIEGLRTKFVAGFSGFGMGYNYPMAFTSKIGVKNPANIVTGSQTYRNLAGSSAPFNSFSITNSLEIDLDHNEYYVPSGTINRISLLTWSGADRVVSEQMYVGEITIHAVGGDVVINAWDPTTNQYGNVESGVTIPSGTSKTFVCNNKAVKSKSANTPATKLAGTGNGAVDFYRGSLVEYLIPPVNFTVTVGAVTGSADSDGNITGTGIDPVSYVDWGTGMFYVKFTSPVGNGVEVNIDYVKYTDWRTTGVFEEVV